MFDFCAVNCLKSKQQPTNNKNFTARTALLPAYLYMSQLLQERLDFARALQYLDLIADN
jgi:hypothetical protein